MGEMLVINDFNKKERHSIARRMQNLLFLFELYVHDRVLINLSPIGAIRPQSSGTAFAQIHMEDSIVSPPHDISSAILSL